MATAAAIADRSPPATGRGWAALAVLMALLAAIWLGVLPWIGGQPQFAAEIRRQQAAGIDPSALFYTELELMPAVIRRFERMPSLSGPPSSSAAPCNSPGSRRNPAR